MPRIDRTLIPELLLQSEEELLGLFATEIAETEQNFLPEPVERIAVSARLRLTTLVEQVKRRICDNHGVKLAVDAHDEVHAAVLVADLIQQTPESLHAVILAVIIVRIGVRNLCANAWRAEKPSQPKADA